MNDLLISEEKAPESLENQGLDGLRSLRNQQVVCSSHITSSKNALKSADFRAFLRVWRTFRGCVIFVDPRRDPHGEMAGKDWRASDRILHDLCHELPHFLCRFVLGLPCGVGVGAESKASVVVSEH